MISGLKIGNFKAFGAAQEIPLRPLTLVFGPNSAGKSSVLQSLLLISHALQNDSLHDACIRAAPGAPDLGGLKNYSHKNDLSKPVSIGLRLDPGEWSGLKPPPLVETGTIDLDRVGRRERELLIGANDEFEAIFEIRSGFSFHFNNRLLISFGGHESGSILVGGEPDSEFPDGRSFPRSGRPFMRQDPSLSCFGDEVDFDHETVRKWISTRFAENTGETLSATLWSAACAAASEQFQTRAWMHGILPSDVSWDNSYKQGMQRARESADAPLSDHLRLIFSLFEEFVFRLIQAVRLRLNYLLGGLVYLGPLRSYTGRRVVNLSSADSSSFGEDFTTAALIGSPTTLELVNRWMEHRLGLLTPYRLVVRHFFESEQDRREFKRRFKGIVEDDPGFFSSPIQELFQRTSMLLEVSLKDLRSGVFLSQKDVGVGISQVLPVLVAACGTWKRWHLIEQPELHLHPAHQAELADLFIESAFGERENRFLIETHSEHLILRLLKRIRQTTGGMDTGLPPVRPDDVAILYVQPTESGSVVLHLRVDQHGRLLDDWPGGFFEESFNEMF